MTDERESNHGETLTPEAARRELRVICTDILVFVVLFLCGAQLQMMVKLPYRIGVIFILPSLIYAWNRSGPVTTDEPQQPQGIRRHVELVLFALLISVTGNGLYLLLRWLFR